MLTIHSSEIPLEIAEEHGLACAVVDSASLMAAQLQQKESFSGCPLPAVYAIGIQPAEDQSIPIFMCRPHFNAFKLGVREGVGVDQEILNQ